VNNNMSAQSGSGVEEFNPRTLDVVAPGDAVWGLCGTDTTRFFFCTDPDNGSSPGISTGPSTSSAASEVRRRCRAGHAGVCQDARRTMPAAGLVERIIDSTATDLGAPADEQGAGLVNALKAVRLAESVNRRQPAGQHAAGGQDRPERDG